MTSHFKAAEMAADWWTERLQQGDKVAFRATLVDLIDQKLEAHGNVKLQVDYDPDVLLVQALLAAGVSNRTWCMYSADGIFPCKHELWVRRHQLVPKEGYGNWTEVIPVPQ
jgi:hypothetical protein